MDHLLKTKKEFKSLKKHEIQAIFTNKLDEACFEHNMAHGDFKDIARRTASGKVFRDKAFNIAKNSKYDGYQGGLASMIYTFFDKKSKGGGVNIPLDFNEQLAKELHKPIIRKL